MAKKLAVITFLSLAVVFSSYAQDGSRLDQLEKEIQSLNARISKLESSLGGLSNSQEPANSSDGWKSVMNWRKLSAGMGPSDVRKILGEPDRLNGGTVAFWYYRNGGRVSFIQDKVQSWIEPSM